ncbi:hypothetical protein [Sporofaciens sp. SGI.106]|uniref:hypothetical protein n=1 Tax=Sporofaciens sp. SGI.106 TaxID=3420568 RepID=UPI003D039EEB
MKEIIPHMKPPWDDGSGPDYSSPYRDLATAIVQLAVKDYKKTLRAIWRNPKSEAERRKLIKEKIELEEFFHSGEYRMYCNIDPDKLIKNCYLTAIEDEKKAISRRNKRKIKNQLKDYKEEQAHETGKSIV